MINRDRSAGIYIHVPFCVQKCSYCDFYSLPLRDKTYMERYTMGLIREIEAQAAGWSGREFSSIYIGGGTPSLLFPEQIDRILRSLYAHLKILPQPEISMEANPATLSLSNLQELRSAGINRLSLGVQSFLDEELKILGRIHGATEVMEAVADLVKAGISNYNLDLIYGIPGQSQENWKYNLQMAVSCQPQHISTYLLQLDPSTPMAKQIEQGRLKALEEDLEADMYYTGVDYLRSQGYQHYEISNFSRPGYACHHNLIYWQACEYLGLGPGAVSYRDGQRWLNIAQLEDYLDDDHQGRANNVEVLETMTHHDQFVDAVILGLRMTAGISRGEFRQRFGIDFHQEYHAIIEKFSRDGILIVDQDRIYLSRRGYFLSNQLMAQLL